MEHIALTHAQLEIDNNTRLRTTEITLCLIGVDSNSKRSVYKSSTTLLNTVSMGALPKIYVSGMPAITFKLDGTYLSAPTLKEDDNG